MNSSCYNSNGNFTMFGGEIINNVATSGGGYGGGIRFDGNYFTMFGGVIANNTAVGNSTYGHLGNGGGVYIEYGRFRLFGGVIANNTALDGNGGGVSYGSDGFTMFGGVIANNTAVGNGGGVSHSGAFCMFDGVISGNVAVKGGGVYSSLWTEFFVMSGGEISDNTAQFGGGVCSISIGIFEISGGVIANNTAIDGGGLNINSNAGTPYPDPESFIVISGCKISDNIAINNGGGVWIDEKYLKYLVISSDVVFENNQASVAYNRNPNDDALYAENIKCTVWTSPFTQGYNNYDISYTRGTPVMYVVSVTGSFASTPGAGNYVPGTTVTINAGSRDGYTFTRWSVTAGSVILSNANSVSATFTMPDRDVALTAIWTANDSGSGSGSGGGSSSGGGGSGGSTNKPSPSTSPSNPAPSETAPPSGGNNVAPSPDDKGASSWSFTMVALIVVTIALAITVVTSVLLWQKTQKNNSTTKL